MAKGKIENYSEWLRYNQFHPFVGNSRWDLDDVGLSIGVKYLIGGEPFENNLNSFSIQYLEPNARLEFPLASCVGFSEVEVLQAQELENGSTHLINLSEINDNEGRRARAETPVSGGESVFLSVRRRAEWVAARLVADSARQVTCGPSLILFQKSGLHLIGVSRHSPFFK